MFYYYSDNDDFEDVDKIRRRRARPKNFKDPTSGLFSSSDTDDGHLRIKSEKSDSEYNITSDEDSASSADSDSTDAGSSNSDADTSDVGTSDSSPDSATSEEDSPVKQKRVKKKRTRVITSDEDSDDNENSWYDSKIGQVTLATIFGCITGTLSLYLRYFNLLAIWAPVGETCWLLVLF